MKFAIRNQTGGFTLHDVDVPADEVKEVDGELTWRGQIFRLISGSQLTPQQENFTDASIREGRSDSPSSQQGFSTNRRSSTTNDRSKGMEIADSQCELVCPECGQRCGRLKNHELGGYIHFCGEHGWSVAGSF